jgi:DNA-binding LacI/PurR family transcriptional regulator
LQAWFSTQRIPTLVLGSCHPGVTLPSLDVDYRSISRHAAGLLQAKGHRRLAFLVPHSDLAGDLASEAGFREGIAPRTAEGRVVRHNGSNSGLASALRILLGSPRPPTALLVAKPRHVFFVMAWLLREGRSVPGQISVIARDHDPLFANLVDHYRFNRDTFARRLGRLVRGMAGQQFLPLAPHLILPRFQAGATIGPPACR